MSDRQIKQLQLSQKGILLWDSCDVNVRYAWKKNCFYVEELDFAHGNGDRLNDDTVKLHFTDPGLFLFIAEF